MGLNPPFGVNAALANKFINKALEFKPKLLILIVPRETQRYWPLVIAFILPFYRLFASCIWFLVLMVLFVCLLPV